LIFVYLPKLEFGVKDAPWATCHFDPTLEVKILGMSEESEAAYRDAPLKHPGTRIGVWLMESQSASRINLIYDDGGAIKHANIGLGGDRVDSDLVEQPAVKGRRFKVADGTDIYDVDRSGNLRVYRGDMSTPVAAARPLR